MSPLHSLLLLLLLLFAAVSPQVVVNQTRTEKVLNPEKPEGDDRGEDVGALLRQLKARVEELERKLEAQLEERGKSCSLTNRGRQQGSGGEEGVWLKTFRCGKNSGLAKKKKKPGCVIRRPGYQTGSVVEATQGTAAKSSNKLIKCRMTFDLIHSSQ